MSGGEGCPSPKDSSGSPAPSQALDPEVRALLELLEADGAPRLADQTPAQARRRMAAIPAHGPRTEPLARVEDRKIAAPSDGRALRVRLYAPSLKPALPVLVYLHGGGWVTGDLDATDYRCRRLAARAGCLVVAADYRLAPEHPFPAAAEDAHDVLQWTLAAAGTIGADAARVAVAGDSSGGNLAAAATLMARDQRAPQPVFQLLTCPVLDSELKGASMEAFSDGYVLGRRDLRWCWEHYLGPDQDGRNAYACPLRAPSLGGLPPALVITAELDPLRDQGEAYARRLRKAGVPVELVRYQGMVHSFVDFEGTLTAAEQALERSAEALRAAWEAAPRR